jgi:hypothetical protein
MTKFAPNSLFLLSLYVAVLLGTGVTSAYAQDASLQVDQFLNAFRGKAVNPIASAPPSSNQSISQSPLVGADQASAAATQQDGQGGIPSCPPGMTTGPGGCIPMAMPANAHRVSADGQWECDGGYVISGATCARAQGIPENAHLTGTGATWECNAGFRAAGNVCVQIHVPPNAHLVNTWSGWACDSGYRMIANWCVAH